MDTSSSTNSNRIGESRLSKNFTPQGGMQETGSMLRVFSSQTRLSISGNFDGDSPIRSLRTPSHVHAHRHLVLNRHGQQRGRLDLEIGERCWNRAGNVRLPIVRFEFKRNLFEVGSLAGELNL